MLWPDSPGICKTHDCVVEGCGKKQGLAISLVRSLINDAPNVGNETHVEHAISFIDHQAFYGAEVDVALV